MDTVGFVRIRRHSDMGYVFHWVSVLKFFTVGAHRCALHENLEKTGYTATLIPVGAGLTQKKGEEHKIHSTPFTAELAAKKNLSSMAAGAFSEKLRAYEKVYKTTTTPIYLKRLGLWK